MIAELVAHDSSPQFGSLNHRGLANRNASGSAPVRRLGAEADINLPTIPAETVENDPEPKLGPAGYYIPPAHAPFRNASRRSLKAAPARGTEWPAPGMIARSALSSRWRTSQIASDTELWPPEVTSFGKAARLSAPNGMSASFGSRAAIVVSTPC